MKLKTLLFLAVISNLLGCSTGSDSSGDTPDGFAKNGNLSVTVEKDFGSVYTVVLSQNGNVYVTTDGSEPSVSNFKYHFTYDYTAGVSASSYCVYLSDVWKADIRVIGIADGYPTETEDGIPIVYEPPKAPEGTTVTLTKSVVIERQSVSATSDIDDTGDLCVIPEWGTAVCSGYWGYVLGGEERYYLMEAGTSGTLRYKINETNSGSFSALYLDGGSLADGDAIAQGTKFYLYARQGSKWSTDASATRYSFDFWVEE